jgi:hypothetical protein
MSVSERPSAHYAKARQVVPIRMEGLAMSIGDIWTRKAQGPPGPVDTDQVPEAFARAPLGGVSRPDQGDGKGPQ